MNFKNFQLLLLESWLKIAEFTKTNFGICPEHYHTLPSLSFACLLKTMKNDGNEIELITDEEMLKFVSQAKRGGLTSIMSERLCYSRKGAKIVKESLNQLKTRENAYLIDQLKKATDEKIKDELKKDEDYHILYLDANNLYGKSQTQKLPLNSFEWCGLTELKSFNLFFENRNNKQEMCFEEIFQQGNKKEYGYFIECDLVITEDQKNLLENFPPGNLYLCILLNQLLFFSTNEDYYR